MEKLSETLTRNLTLQRIVLSVTLGGELEITTMETMMVVLQARVIPQMKGLVIWRVIYCIYYVHTYICIAYQFAF